jgi:hypothetical protein
MSQTEDAYDLNTDPSASLASDPAQSTEATASSSGFAFEVLVSAGPRKDRHEYDGGLYRELGEDAAGLVTLPGMTLFWLSDGVSDEAILPGFSARLLAQDAGNMLAQSARQLYCDQHGQFAFLELIQQTLRGLLQAWQVRAEERWRVLLQRNETDSFLGALDLGGDGTLRKSWSATFVAGRIDHNTGLLEAVNLGDGAFLIQQQGAALQALDRSSARVWLCMENLPAGDSASPLRFKMQEKEVQASDILSFERVQWVLCMTDGATSGPIQATIRAQGSVEGLVALLKGSRQKTYDDRTLILGRRLDLSTDR